MGEWGCVSGCWSGVWCSVCNPDGRIDIDEWGRCVGSGFDWSVRGSEEP